MLSRYTSSTYYYLTNFLPLVLVGAPLSGRLSDRIILYYQKKRGGGNGEWYPEDRLRAALPGALFLVPLSVLISGLLTEYVPGPLGLGLNLVCLFANGMGVIFFFFFFQLNRSLYIKSLFGFVY